MSNELIAKFDTLPAHIAALQADKSADNLITSGPSFARLSVKGGKFRLRKDGEERVIPLQEMNVIIVATTPVSNHTAKVFYKGKYIAGDDSPPACLSSDGIRPDSNVESPQSATTCAVCPQNQWGSRKTNEGKDARACSDLKVLYVVVPKGDGVSSEVVQLRVPTMSLKNLSIYARQLREHKVPVMAALTKLSFNDAVEYPELRFNFGGYVSEAQLADVQEIAAGDVIRDIISGVTPIDATATSTPAALPAAEPVKVAPAPAKVAPAPAPVQDDFDLDDLLGEEEEEEEAPSPTVEVDADGRIWDERIDSGSKKKTAKGKWARRKNLDDAYYLEIKKSLLPGAKAAAPAPVAEPEVIVASEQPVVVDEPDTLTADAELEDLLEGLL